MAGLPSASEWTLTAQLSFPVNPRLLARLLFALLLVAGFFVAALVESVALVPTVVMGVSFLGLFVAVIFGAVTRRWGALKWCGLIFLTSTVGNVVGFLTYLELRRGDEAVAAALVRALDEHRRERGAYPENLEALVPTHLGALPAARFGQAKAPYFYQQREGEFTLSYPTGFNASRRYDSRTKTWQSQD